MEENDKITSYLFNHIVFAPYYYPMGKSVYWMVRMEKTTLKVTLVHLIVATVTVLGGTAAFLILIVSLIKDDFSRTTQDHWEQRYAVVFSNQKKLEQETAELFKIFKKKYPALFAEFKEANKN